LYHAAQPQAPAFTFGQRLLAHHLRAALPARSATPSPPPASRVLRIASPVGAPRRPAAPRRLFRAGQRQKPVHCRTLRVRLAPGITIETRQFNPARSCRIATRGLCAAGERFFQRSDIVRRAI